MASSRTSRYLPAILLAFCALVVWGCGGDSDETNAPATRNAAFPDEDTTEKSATCPNDNEGTDNQDADNQGTDNQGTDNQDADNQGACQQHACDGDTYSEYDDKAIDAAELDKFSDLADECAVDSYYQDSGTGKGDDENDRDSDQREQPDEYDPVADGAVILGRLIEVDQTEELILDDEDPHATVCQPAPCRPGAVDWATSSAPDLVVVAFGDSYASGEGAPFRNHRRDWDTNIVPDDPQWPASLASRDALWGPDYCHRSPRSAFALAMVDVQEALPHVRLA
ncbi:MAG: hypothetical protein H8E59_08405 [Actinobacteria bacterium]|nr:hypothetical protein [Actinomycetota bacterium]